MPAPSVRAPPTWKMNTAFGVALCVEGDDRTGSRDRAAPLLWTPGKNVAIVSRGGNERRAAGATERIVVRRLEAGDDGGRLPLPGT